MTYIVIFALLRIFIFRKQILITLIRLEIVTLTLFIRLIFKLARLSQPISIAFFILILGACEASLALRLIVIMTRLKGRDILRLIRKFKF